MSAPDLATVSAIATASNSNTINTNAPAGVVSGDLLHLVVASRSGATTSPATPAGWVEVVHLPSSQVNSSHTVFRRIADGTSDDTPTVVYPDSRDLASVMYRITGASGDPFDVAGSAVGSFTGSVAIPTVSVDADNSLAIVTLLMPAPDRVSNWPGSWSKEDEQQGTPDTDAVIAVGTQPVDSGTSPGGNVTWTGGSTRGLIVTTIYQPDEEPPEPTFKPHWIQRRNTMIGGGVL